MCCKVCVQFNWNTVCICLANKKIIIRIIHHQSGRTIYLFFWICRLLAYMERDAIQAFAKAMHANNRRPVGESHSRVQTHIFWACSAHTAACTMHIHRSIIGLNVHLYEFILWSNELGKDFHRCKNVSCRLQFGVNVELWVNVWVCWVWSMPNVDYSNFPIHVYSTLRYADSIYILRQQFMVWLISKPSRFNHWIFVFIFGLHRYSERIRRQSNDRLTYSQNETDHDGVQ